MNEVARMSKIIEIPISEAARYQAEYGVSSLIAQVLAADEVSREHVLELLQTEDYVRCEDQRFVLAKNMIETALLHQEKILICGDYDADGLCATSIMVRTLRRLKADVGFYIPDRFNEGYGLIPETVAKAIEKGYTLFITVDNGVGAFDALKAIHEANGRSIVLDHHEITAAVECDLLIHPSLFDQEFQNLCGSGLALQLAEHLIGYDVYNTALAGIATVGDMVDLWGANRKIVLNALSILNSERFAPIEALSEKHVDFYDEETIAFQIVPKLNVAGRLADVANANRIVDYLCSDSATEIARQSLQIIDLNTTRKRLSNAMYDTARTLRTQGNVVVLTHHSFHEGIVGITAGRLAKEIGRPVFVFAQKGNTLK
ncbi:MAG: recombinase RecJ, partial [Erysipelotrichales bacterium]